MSESIALFEIVAEGRTIATVADAPGPVGSTAYSSGTAAERFPISLWSSSAAHEDELGQMLRATTDLRDFLTRIRARGWQAIEVSEPG